MNSTQVGMLQGDWSAFEVKLTVWARGEFVGIYDKEECLQAMISLKDGREHTLPKNNLFCLLLLKQNPTILFPHNKYYSMKWMINIDQEVATYFNNVVSTTITVL